MIAYFDYRPEYRKYRDEIDEAIRRVIESGRLILGPEVEAFERECAASVGVEHGVGVNSGTDALALALRALGVGPEDEVLTVANAGVPTISAIRTIGAIPRFVEIDANTLLMDPAGLERARSPRTRAVIPIHLYGQPAPLDPILAFAVAHGLHVIEDCAQAQGAHYRDRPVGSFGEVGCFSFYPTKTLGAFGDGGLCVTRDAGVAERLRLLRMYGFDERRHARIEGVNSRLDEMQAAILRVKLRHHGEMIEERRTIAARYRAGLAGSSLGQVGLVPDGTHVYHLFVIRSAERGELTRHLGEAGIGFGTHYPEPVHTMEAYRFLGHRDGDLPITERACAEVVSLPMWIGLPDAEIDRVIGALAHQR